MSLKDAQRGVGYSTKSSQASAGVGMEVARSMRAGGEGDGGLAEFSSGGGSGGFGSMGRDARVRPAAAVIQVTLVAFGNG